MDKKETHKHSEVGEHKALHHRVYHHVKKHKTKWLIGLFGAVLIILIIFLIMSLTPKIAKVGDTVKVNYVGTLKDGSVFDTSLEDVAKKNNMYNSQRQYAPLQFKIGSNMVLKDFEDAVLGMKKGDVKRVSIPADRAYPYDEKLVFKDVPKKVVIKNAYNIPIQAFESATSQKAVVGNEYSFSQLPWKVKVTGISNDTVSFYALAKAGDVIPMPYRGWNATILEVSEQNITLMQENIPMGGVVISPDGAVGKVVKISTDSYDVDMNLPIAGKDLDFEITLVEIIE